MSLKKVLLTKKLNNVVYEIFPKTSADIVTYGEGTVADALAGFANDLKNYYTSAQTDSAIKTASDDLYNKIMGITAEDGATVNEAFDTLKEVAAWIEEHGDVATGFSSDIKALQKAVGDENSGLIKGLADAVSSISDNTNDIGDLQEAVEELEAAVGDANSGLVKSVADHETRIGKLEGAVGDSSKGLVKDVSDLKTTVGDATDGLVKDVADLKAVGSTKVEASETNGNIKINGTETNVYTHPATHEATMIAEDDDHKFVTSTEKDIIASAAAVVLVSSEDQVANERDLYLVEI